MSKKKITVKRGLGLLLAVILAVRMIFPSVVKADDSSFSKEESYTEESNMTVDESQESIPEEKSESDSDEDTDSAGELGEEDFALDDVEDIPMTADNNPSSGNRGIYVNLGSSYPYRLNYTRNEEYGTLFLFECPEDGFYTAFSDDTTNIGVDYTYGTGIYYRVYNADEDGNIDYRSKIYDNYSRSGFQNPWYSDFGGGAVYMEGGKTYYLYLRNQCWDGLPHDITVELRHRETQFMITNNSTEGTGAKEVVLNFATLSSGQGSVYGYVEGDFGKLTQLTEEERRNQSKEGIKISLEPGESKMISVIPYDTSMSWNLITKYSEDYDTAFSGDKTGTWKCDAELHTYNISFTCTPAEDSAEMTTFHLISDLSELNTGDHYIFAAKQGDNYYALSCDFMNFVTPIALDATELTNAAGETYSGYTMDVSQRDLTKGDYVMECMQPGDVSNNYTPNAKFRSNIVDPETGKRLALKMGRWRGDSPMQMFSETSGDINIRKNEDGEGYSFYHSGYARLVLETKSSGEAVFLWNGKYYTEANADIIILTDSQVKPKEEEKLQGEQLFTRISAFDLNYHPLKEDRILLVCEGDDGTHYAFTTQGPIPIGDPTSEVFPTVNYSDPEPTIRTDVSYSYSPVGLRYGYYGYDFYYTVTGFEQNGKYLFDWGYMYPNKEEPYASDSPIDFDLLVIKDAIESFDPWTYNSNCEYYAYAPVIKLINAYLGWDPASKNFCEVDNIENAVRFELYRMKPGFAQEEYHEVDDLSDIENWEKILITVEGAEGKQKALVFNEYDLGLIDVADATDQPYNPYNPVYFSSDDTLTAVSRCALTPGNIISISKTNFKIKSLTWKDVNRSLYLDGYVKNGSMTDTQEKECMFSYGADGNSILLRGAKNWLFFDPETGELSTVTDKESATKVRIWAIDRDEKDPVDVIYYTPDKNILRELTTKKDIDLMELPETINSDVEYIFVGWSTDENSCGFLSLEDSCNLYDYYDATDTGYINHLVAEKYSILGNCTPDVIDSIDPYAYAVDGKLELYPVYARKSFDSAVTADDEDGTPIIGISDWKDLQGQRPQGGHDDDEQWLGKIYCNVYLDGELWVDSEPLYFCYHNDDAADINLKFISDELLGTYQDHEDPLLAFMSDDDAYPAASQKGNYVIDAVYASQGGSEDGLKYRYNWISNNGGRLDNVQGGSTVSVYVTTLYQVEYFLDDVELTGDAWQNANVYATPGTDNAVENAIEASDYVVKMDNDLHALMDRSTDDDSTFVDENIIRGDYSSFVYYIQKYRHTIPVAEFPEIPADKEFTTNAWEMKVPKAGEGDISLASIKPEVDPPADLDDPEESSEDDSFDSEPILEVAAKVVPGSDYDIKGTGYGTENTVFAWMDGFDDSLYTYHLYIYTKDKDAESSTTPDSSFGERENGSSAVRTGENSIPSVYGIVMEAVLAAVIGVVVCLRRKREQDLR